MASTLEMQCCCNKLVPYSYCIAYVPVTPCFLEETDTYQVCGTQFRNGNWTDYSGCENVPYNPAWTFEEWSPHCRVAGVTPPLYWYDGCGDLHTITNVIGDLAGYTVAEIFRLPPSNGLPGYDNILIQAKFNFGTLGNPIELSEVSTTFTTGDRCCCNASDGWCPDLVYVTKPWAEEWGNLDNCRVPTFGSLAGMSMCDIMALGWQGGRGTLDVLYAAYNVQGLTNFELCHPAGSFWYKLGLARRSATCVLNIEPYIRSGWAPGGGTDWRKWSWVRTYMNGTYNYDWPAGVGTPDKIQEPQPVHDNYFARIGCPPHEQYDWCGMLCDDYSETTANADLYPFAIFFSAVEG